MVDVERSAPALGLPRRENKTKQGGKKGCNPVAKKKGFVPIRFSEERKQERRWLVKNAEGLYEVMRSVCFSGEKKKEKNREVTRKWSHGSIESI